VHFKSTPKDLERTQSPLQKNWSAQNSTPKMSNFWSEQLPTPICLEWTAVHSIFFGVDTFPLQNVEVHVVKVWSAFSLALLFLQFFFGFHNGSVIA
jgi:predicted transporter